MAGTAIVGVALGAVNACGGAPDNYEERGVTSWYVADAATADRSVPEPGVGGTGGDGGAGSVGVAGEGGEPALPAVADAGQAGGP